jgi:hypothetical protein
LEFQAEGAIFQKIQEQGFAGHPNQTVQLRTEIKIPPEAVGRIIGRRGAKVILSSSQNILPIALWMKILQSCMFPFTSTMLAFFVGIVHYMYRYLRAFLLAKMQRFCFSAFEVCVIFGM